MNHLENTYGTLCMEGEDGTLLSLVMDKLGPTQIVENESWRHTSISAQGWCLKSNHSLSSTMEAS